MEKGGREWKEGGGDGRRERGFGRGVMGVGGREGVEGEHSKALAPVVLCPCV